VTDLTEMTPADEPASSEAIVDSSTTMESQPEENGESGKVPLSEAAQKRFDSITAEKYDFKNKYENSQKELEEVRQKLEAIELEKSKPQAVDKPNPELYLDDPDEYARRLDAYTESQRQQSVYESNQAAREAERQRQEENARLAQQQDLMSRTEKNAQEHGLDFNQVVKDGYALEQRGANPMLSSFVANHENVAPLITHLVQNPADFDQLNRIQNPVELGRQLDALQSKALTRNVSTAPEPVDTLSGLPAREADEFEKLCPNAKFI